MAESFGLSQLGQLINGKSIYATSGVASVGSSYPRSFSAELPDDISCVIGQFSLKAAFMATGACVFIPDGDNHFVALYNDRSVVANVTTNLSTNYRKAEVTVNIDIVYIAILAW